MTVWSFSFDWEHYFVVIAKQFHFEGTNNHKKIVSWFLQIAFSALIHFSFRSVNKIESGNCYFLDFFLFCNIIQLKHWLSMRPETDSHTACSTQCVVYNDDTESLSLLRLLLSIILFFYFDSVVLFWLTSNDSYSWIFRQFVDFIFILLTNIHTTKYGKHIAIFCRFVWLTMFIYYSNKYLVKRQFTYRFAANK